MSALSCPKCAALLRQNTHPFEVRIVQLLVIVVLVGVALTAWTNNPIIGAVGIVILLVLAAFHTWFYFVRLKTWRRWALYEPEL